uniref:Putative ovule protein n=1 Tax=Solanum chacoense TaxID=4108 RepID=A0A0V0HP71_SOLCH
MKKISSFGNEPVTCFCYDRPGWDTIDHIFNTGHFATHVWRYFTRHTGIQTDHTPLIHLIMRWWSTKSHNEAHKLILQATQYSSAGMYGRTGARGNMEGSSLTSLELSIQFTRTTTSL